MTQNMNIRQHEPYSEMIK